MDGAPASALRACDGVSLRQPGRGGGDGTGGIAPSDLLLEAAHIARRCMTWACAISTRISAPIPPPLPCWRTQSAARPIPLPSMAPKNSTPRARFRCPKRSTALTFTVAISSFGRSQLYRWAGFADWSKHQGGALRRSKPGAMPHPSRCPTEPAQGPTSGGHRPADRTKGLSPAGRDHGYCRQTDCPALHLTICGDGELRGLIEAEIARHGLSDHITIAGWMYEAEVRATIAAAPCADPALARRRPADGGDGGDGLRSPGDRHLHQRRARTA